ncbi:MAG TPA: hypothetical protein VN238_15820 [Solirubrobacteraceae bacterium]|nr:hypothetical protein [Solirubrobacteraceae bacterium]
MILVGALSTALGPDGAHGPRETVYVLVAVIALGVGGSILASGLIDRVVARQVFGLDVAEAVEALRGTSPLVRSNQTLVITLISEAAEIRVAAEHSFELREASWRRKRLVLRLYTDVARWGSSGGFISIVEPDRTLLEGERLANHVREESGKTRFEKAYTFHPGVPASFTVETFGHFRTNDRLIWTVEHISSDFKVRINDCTGLDGDLEVKVNHHREREVIANMTRRPYNQGRMIEFDYMGEILPYQGFELQWSLRTAAPTVASTDETDAYVS